MRLGRLRAEPGFLLLIALFLFLDRNGTFLALFCSWMLHEGAHIAAICLRGGSVKEIYFTLNGAKMWVERAIPLSYGEELLATLAGPGSNLLVCVLCARLGERWYLLAGVNLALGVFNLLPVPGLDGGRVLTLLGNLLRDERKEQKR